jgi:hypothetical protein
VHKSISWQGAFIGLRESQAAPSEPGTPRYSSFPKWLIRGYPEFPEFNTSKLRLGYRA